MNVFSSYLSVFHSLFPVRETEGNKWLPLSSLLGVGWQRSRWWFKQWIYEHHNLNVAERKEKDSHQTPLTNALANINALLIHPICCLIAFLYTVIWHLLLKSGVRRGEIEERGWRWWGGVVKGSVPHSLFPSFSLPFFFLWWMQGCGSCARPVSVPN